MLLALLLAIDPAPIRAFIQFGQLFYIENVRFKVPARLTHIMCHLKQPYVWDPAIFSIEPYER
jgi:hypothetical protein